MSKILQRLVREAKPDKTVMELKYVPISAHEQNGHLLILKLRLELEAGFDVFDSAEVDATSWLRWVRRGGGK